MHSTHKNKQERGITSYKKGKLAEHFALLYFLIHGYRIIATRARTPYGEIDLILRRRGTIVFAEVKMRQTLEECAYAITQRQQQRLVKAARFLMRKRSLQGAETFRFDALFFLSKSWGLPHHMKNIIEDTLFPIAP